MRVLKIEESWGGGKEIRCAAIEKKGGLVPEEGTSGDAIERGSQTPSVERRLSEEGNAEKPLARLKEREGSICGGQKGGS